MQFQEVHCHNSVHLSTMERLQLFYTVKASLGSCIWARICNFSVMYKHKQHWGFEEETSTEFSYKKLCPIAAGLLQLLYNLVVKRLRCNLHNWHTSKQIHTVKTETGKRAEKNVNGKKWNNENAPANMRNIWTLCDRFVFDLTVSLIIPFSFLFSSIHFDSLFEMSNGFTFNKKTSIHK